MSIPTDEPNEATPPSVSGRFPDEPTHLINSRGQFQSRMPVRGLHTRDVDNLRASGGESWPVDGMAEPPDGTRLEFEWCTDVCAVARDDESSREAGYVVGDGGAVWCVYGEGVPCTWQELIERFGGDALRNAVCLTPVVADLPNRERWPTAVYARTGVWPVDGQSSPTKTAETRRHLMGGEP